MFPNNSQESHIALLLSSINDPQNRCIPVYEVLRDPYQPQTSLMVMPYLRPCNDPDFVTVGDIIEFVGQTLEVSIRLRGALSESKSSDAFSGPRLLAQTTNSSSVCVVL